MTYDEQEEVRWIAERLANEAITTLREAVLVSLRIGTRDRCRSAFEDIETTIKYLQRAQDKLMDLVDEDEE